MIGFAPFNRPVARLFLGDVGSLPIGLLLGWLLCSLAGRGHSPRHSCCRSIISPMRPSRCCAGSHGENVWQAHRSHFYQRATARGFTVSQVMARVFAVNVVLVVLAVASAATRSLPLRLAALAAGAFAVALLLAWMWRGKR